jgi:dTDP-4-dehydrorhamnose 3,5-epimerase
MKPRLALTLLQSDQAELGKSFMHYSNIQQSGTRGADVSNAIDRPPAIDVRLPTIRCEIPDPAMPEIKVLTPRRFGDDRGFFSEVYNAGELRALGVGLPFVQDNHSRSAAVGTVRGLHYQAPPFAQDKLVRVTCGAILDVAVDIRRNSPTFGRWVAVVISAELWNQLFIPVGFAHGFCTIEPNTEVLYKVTNFYSPDHDRGIAWDDPALAIAWPVKPEEAVLSLKDRALPPLAAARACFSYP